MSYKQPSGSQKRKRKFKHEIETKALKGSLDKYVTFKSNENSNLEEIPQNDGELQPVSENGHEKTDDCLPSSSSNDGSGEILAQVDSTAIFASLPENSLSAVNLCCSKDSLTHPNDVGLWPDIITEEFREYFVHNKPEQYIDHISSSRCLIGKKERLLNESNFFRKKGNNQLIKREWLVYSPTKKAIFCYICVLFSSSDQALCKGGFSYWKNTTERLREHENSVIHRNSVLLLSQRMSSSRIDSRLVEDFKAECNYWRKVLMRVVASIKFLSQRGLAFFGSDETIMSSKNGNFLGSLEFLSNFDPFLADHLAKRGNPGTGNVNYLSSTIVTEVIEIMGSKVLNVIVSEVQKAKYFGLIVDSTPDVTHNDQLAIVLRYVNEKGESLERFLKFIQIHSHESSHLTAVIISLFEELNIDVKNCRGQSYDNASNMSGKYSGLQARIKSLSPLAEYIPCSAHSLNLVGTTATECCEAAISFFGLVQSLYTFFSGSTYRWEILSKKLDNRLTIKSLSVTRWSAAADATKCLRYNFKNIMEALQEISGDSNEKNSTRHEAKTLHKKMEKFETAVLAVIWDAILQRINSVNKALQSTNGDISHLVPLYESLIQFIQSVRDDYERYESEASNIMDKEYRMTRKKKIPKRLHDEISEDLNLSSRDIFITQCHYVICDSLLSELDKRKSAYVMVENRFGFLMKSNDDENIKTSVKHFKEIYNSDIDEEFEGEILHFLKFLSRDISPDEKLKIIRKQNISHTFPNVDTALQILLTMPISNCSSERSFSVLKRIKNRLRNATKQDKLTALSILCIESDLTSKLDFNDVIDTFAAKKARKMPL